MTTIELTDQQRQAVQTEQGKPIDVLDPATQQRYVLIAQEQYERVRSLLDRESAVVTEDALAVAPGILRSQQAFWRDLPELLKNKKHHGKWVCYNGDVRVGIATDDVPLIRECLRRNLSDDQYDLFVIRPRDIPPWEPEDIEPLGPWHFDDDPPPS